MLYQIFIDDIIENCIPNIICNETTEDSVDTCISVLHYVVPKYLLLRCIVLKVFHLRPPPHFKIVPGSMDSPF